ncbi:MAG: RNA 2'-phosphotransferase [Pseudomonadota bacterium]
MSNAARTKHISKFISLVLRHAPETIGIELDAQGWVDVGVLLECAGRHGEAITREELDTVVSTSDKQRFAFSEDRRCIRANQGHSLAAVDLGLAPAEPPAVLYHGTTQRYLASIREEGLRPGARNHVHLSRDRGTGFAVGQRHGTPVVLTVDAAAMHSLGYQFYVSDNGVWLALEVPPRFITFPSQSP